MTLHHIVSPDKISSELETIWSSLEVSGKMRASLFNLIIYTTDNARVDYFHEIALKIIEKFPSRIIFITSDCNKSNDYLKTAVSALTSQKGEGNIGCDFIQIAVAGKMAERIPFLILPHLLSDLPVYLLWGENPAVYNSILVPMEHFASKIIFDSESTNDLYQFKRSLLFQKDKLGCAIADLNWARIEYWRNILTSTFNHVEKLTQLLNADTIRITYNNQTTDYFCHTKIKSIYLQGWIASKLMWQHEKTENKDNGLIFTYLSNNNQRISVILEPTSKDGFAPGAIVEVDILSKMNHNFNFKRNEPNRITVNISTPKKCEIPLQYFIPSGSPGDSLVKEICSSGTDSQFIDLLSSITESSLGHIC